jgi:hypothetical protein
MSTFEVYYIVKKCERQVDKIVGGPYYELLEAFDARRKLKNDCYRRDTSFEVMTHILELVKEYETHESNS